MIEQKGNLNLDSYLSVLKITAKAKYNYTMRKTC